MTATSGLHALVLAVLLFLACATLPAAPPTVALGITSNVPDASVWIDDHLVAAVSTFSKSEKRLPVGFHRVEIRAPGYYSWFAEVEAQANAPIALHAPLHPLLE
jgi:hypothetical protein